VGQGQLLGIDPPGHGVMLLDLARIEAGINQPPPLLSAQGMAREHQGNAQAAAQQRRHITGIGVVGMDQIRPLILL